MANNNSTYNKSSIASNSVEKSISQNTQKTVNNGNVHKSSCQSDEVFSTPILDKQQNESALSIIGLMKNLTLFSPIIGETKITEEELNLVVKEKPEAEVQKRHSSKFSKPKKSISKKQHKPRKSRRLQGLAPG